MKNNIVRFMDYQAEDALALMVEQTRRERRAEQERRERQAKREKRRRVRWITNAVLIGMIALAAFAAGLCAGCL